MRDFYITDFKEEVIDELMQKRNIEDDEIIAVPFNEDLNATIPHVAGSWENIQKLIPILKDMGYTQMHLYYEDCNIWILQWHNSEFDNAEWVLASYE